MAPIKKILLVGKFSTTAYTYASSFQHAFQSLGYDVTTFNIKQNFIFGLPQNYRLFAPLNSYLGNRALINVVKKHEPDCIFFLKADIITPATLRTIKKISPAKLVHFYPDNPFSLWNSNANANVLRALPLFDHFLIWSKMLIPALESAGCKTVSYLPFAYDETIFEQELTISNTERERYAADVSFIGTWEPERAWWLSKLRTRMPHLNLAIWGNGWEHERKNNLTNCIKGPALYPPESLKAFRCSTINLNFIRRQNMTSHNMRTFELPASKSFMLTQHSHEQCHELFKENVSIACFESIDELIEKITFYLHNAAERQVIIKNAFEQAGQYQLSNVLETFLKTENNEKIT